MVLRSLFAGTDRPIWGTKAISPRVRGALAWLLFALLDAGFPGISNQCVSPNFSTFEEFGFMVGKSTVELCQEENRLEEEPLFNLSIIASFPLTSY